jgi:hypothetical protein
VKEDWRRLEEAPAHIAKFSHGLRLAGRAPIGNDLPLTRQNKRFDLGKLGYPYCSSCGGVLEKIQVYTDEEQWVYESGLCDLLQWGES